MNYSQPRKKCLMPFLFILKHETDTEAL